MTPGSVISMLVSPTVGLVYTLRLTGTELVPTTVQRPGPDQPPVILALDDSALVMVMNPSTHASDTLTKTSTGVSVTVSLSASGTGTRSGGSLFPFVDGLAVANDGTIAVLRSREYRIEWINADRTHALSPRLPFAWHRITDDDRAGMLDSLNRANSAAFDKGLARWISDSANGHPQMFTSSSTRNGETVTTQTVAPRAKPPAPLDSTVFAEVPDFFPPTGRNAILADADNNVWLLPRAGATDDPTYDVINRKGVLIDRVRIPLGRTIVGFAPGFVFVTVSDAGAVTLQKVKIR